MVKIHNLGFPKIGKNREWKKAIENYWQSKITLDELLDFGKKQRYENWQLQSQKGIDYVPVGDFNYYDHILNASLHLGVVPERFNIDPARQLTLDDMFFIARGRSQDGATSSAAEMTKWFDTNYHYLVPEFKADQEFKLNFFSIFSEIKECLAAGFRAKPVFIGPISYLWLGKTKDSEFDKLKLLPDLIKAYQELLDEMSNLGVEWIQLDEPVLVLELEKKWQDAFKTVYQSLKRRAATKLMIATYFGDLGANEELALSLDVDGWHLDAVLGSGTVESFNEKLSNKSVLSVGIVDGRSVWVNDLKNSLAVLRPIYESRGNNLWLAPSCSLLHCPVDLASEEKMDLEIKSWLAFSYQKLAELTMLKLGLLNQYDRNFLTALQNNTKLLADKSQSSRIKNPVIRDKLNNLQLSDYKRNSEFKIRKQTQKQALKLPLFPTTTIGSFPQTSEIRKTRQLYRQGKLSPAEYDSKIKSEIDLAIEKQHSLGLDVLVHGEPERNDMVEYFSDQLAGFAFSENGWVQSYGSRCVKPPIIYGDITRLRPMTLEWSKYALSKTDRLMKGMLTGPVTMLRWSFVRDDLSAKEVAFQLALAISEEVLDLESAGIKIIQIDEPAFREGMPLKASLWPDYFDWTIAAFKIASSRVKDETQIHTHMCYSEFNDIIDAIAAMDADVISIEAFRSDFELISKLKEFNYPNDIGPGVYDIHSPNVPEVLKIVDLLEKAIKSVDPEKLWINPDCGLKTRKWVEVEPSLKNMVQAAQRLREKYSSSGA